MSHCDEDHEELILEIRRLNFPNLFFDIQKANLNPYYQYDKYELISIHINLGIKNILTRNPDIKEKSIRHKMEWDKTENGTTFHDCVLYIRYV